MQGPEHREWEGLRDPPAVTAQGSRQGTARPRECQTQVLATQQGSLSILCSQWQSERPAPRLPDSPL